MLATHYIRPENQTVIWNVITNMDIFKQIQPKERQIAFFQHFIGQAYDELLLNKIPYSVVALQEANRHTLRQMVAELKPTPPPLPPKKAASQTLDDLYASRRTEYEAANSKPNLPDNPFELPKDEPITNIDELIEQHKSNTFSAFDAARMNANPMLTHKTPQEQTQVILDVQRQLGELRDEIAQLKKLIGNTQVV